MAFVTIDNLRAGMVVAFPLLDKRRRVLLRAGVALTQGHIRALRSLGIPGLEVRGTASPHAAPARQTPPLPPAVRQTAVEPPACSNRVEVRKTLETLRVTRAASKPLRPTLEPATARQADALMNDLLKGLPLDPDSGVVAVVRLCATRLLRARSVRNRTP